MTVGLARIRPRSPVSKVAQSETEAGVSHTMKPVLFALAITAGLTASSAFAADNGTQIGVLTCKMDGIDNYVVYTKEEFACVYKPNTGEPQTYRGVIKQVGVNLSITKDNTMIWGVFAPVADMASTDALKGTYVGGTTQVEIGGGVAANVLVGGSGQTISFQPISVNGMTGFGAALDITAFELK